MAGIYQKQPNSTASSKWLSFCEYSMLLMADTYNIPSGETFSNKLISI